MQKPWKPNLFSQIKQISYNGRVATPRPLTESDLIDIEESYSEEERKQRTDSLWDTLVDHFVKKKLPSFDEPLIDTKIVEIIPDMDDITAEVFLFII